jgi:hypothetical protein
LYKVIYILSLALVLVSGCSVSKKTVKSNTLYSSRSSKDILELTQNQNITGSSFFIEKGRIATSGASERIKLLFTMKFRQPGIWLISLKSTTGIEAFRVYITNDTVLINDRINKVLYVGKPFDFERFSAMPTAMLKLIVGDFFYEKEMVDVSGGCNENRLPVEDYYRGMIVKSVIDCSLGKTAGVTLGSGMPNEIINIFYSNYRNDFYKTPGRIEINDSGRNIKISIRIEKLSVPWNGEIEFIPGKGYLKKRL